MMKMILKMVVVAMMTAMSVQAQKIKTVDKNGQPIPYASVFNEDGNLIGTTDLNGVLEDVKGAKVVSISHVAYMTKKVQVEQDGCITLEDADFALPEITVTKKPLVYVQTYYRFIIQFENSKTPIYYYRAGVLNNSYEKKTKKVSTNEHHFSACNRNLLKPILNPLIRKILKKVATLKTEKFENSMKNQFKDIELSFIPDGPNKQLIKDKFGIVGTITDNKNKGDRRYSFDGIKMSLHKMKVAGSKRKKAKIEKLDKEMNYTDRDYTVYHIDENGNYSPEDFVMSQRFRIIDNTKQKRQLKILLQVFTTERAYVNKDELEKLKKDNKMKMTYENLKQFERNHHIPPLSGEFLKQLHEIVE